MKQGARGVRARHGMRAASSCGRGAVGVLSVLVLVGWWVSMARGGEEQAPPSTQPGEAPAATASDGQAYPITAFEFAYVQHRPGLPPIDELKDVEVELGQTSNGLVALSREIRYPVVRFKLGEAPPGTYYNSALVAIFRQIVEYYNQKKGIAGIYVAADSRDLDPPTADDVRQGRTQMRVTVLVGAVTEVRTVAAGENVKGAERINLPRHERIRAGSPVQAGVESKDLLLKKELDSYIYRLNRMPYRRVDLAVSSSGEGGGVALDYLVSEAKPWSVYAQVSNTGTKQTSDWRERIGFTHNQLTGRDDVLALDFVTASFDESNAVLGSYEAPVFSLDRLRWKVYAAWSEFTASDVGQGEADFEGEETSFGGELIFNFFQDREFFLDLVGGLKFKNVTTNNITADQEGEGEFWEPYVGLRVERTTDRASTMGGVTLLWGISSDVKTRSGSAGTVESPDGLGRQDADEDWTALQAELTQSFFLEPLFRRQYKTLAHEALFRARAQYAFGNRLIPQEQEVAGGMYSVRGYPESVVAGDTVVMGSAEYRFHLPRALKPYTEKQEPPRILGSSFRVRPQQEFGRTDWDLVLKGFIDAARVVQSDRIAAFENDNTLVGAGVGVELQFRQNVTLRVDYGVALHDVTNEVGGTAVDSGDSRVHVSFTVLY